jgi:hypothetical protein
MAEITPETIVVRFDADASRWSASFQSVPQVEYGGDLPLRAVRRLLEGIVAWPDNYPLHFDPDDSGHGVPHRWLVWDPPEILLECSTCRGTGQYVGLAEVATCEVCGGRMIVPA